MIYAFPLLCFYPYIGEIRLMILKSSFTLKSCEELEKYPCQASIFCFRCAETKSLGLKPRYLHVLKYLPLGAVAYACNPSYLEGRNHEDCSLRLTLSKNARSCLKNSQISKRDEAIAQMVEFPPSKHKALSSIKEKVPSRVKSR
jgi:hypothetical protein